MRLSDFHPDVQAKLLAANPRHAPRTAPVEIPRDRYRSQLERDYAAHLDLLKTAGEIVWWGHECVKLLLGGKKNKAWFTPDFIVVFPDGRTQAHETKGFMREAAQVRTNVAAGLYPWPIIVIKRGAVGWEREEF